MAFIKNISANHKTDKELLAAFTGTGDINHLSTLYLRYMELVYGVCLKYFNDTERSKDAVMDIFNELNTKLKLHEVDHFKGWLHTVARNHCLMQLRSPKNIQTTEFKPGFMYSEAYTHLDNEALEKEENFKKLAQCMGTLPNEQQLTVRLFYLESKCYKEIAEITGFDWNKVRSNIQNGKRNLRICLDGKEVGGGGS